MLALSRGEGESLILRTSDGAITITVMKIQVGHQVRLAIDAPDVVDIERDDMKGRRDR